MKFERFLKLISKIENISLPADKSHFKMEPPFRRELEKQQNNVVKNAKQAAVLALFYPDENNETRFVLILRKTYKGVHSAQVSFPGGKKENQDNALQDTALRETFEEVGVSQKTIKIVKQLSQVYIPPSNFYMQPFIGLTRYKPSFVKQENEVEMLIEVYFKDLLKKESLITKKIKTSYSAEAEVPAFKLNDYVVWGATAMVLSEIKDLLKQFV